MCILSAVQDKIHILPTRKINEPGRVSRQHVPTPLTPLIGREHEVAGVCRLLQRPEVRLLTLTGTGGVGKTRLALAVVTELLDDFTDGVCFVSLAPISDPYLVLSTIAQAFDLKETPDWLPLEHLKVYLREKHLLLLLDNFEQVIAAASQLTFLLASCPRLRILVTSRAALHLSGEQEYPVSPLPVPDLTQLPELETLAQMAAVRLFVLRAQAIQPTFALTSANAPTIAAICAQLDGLPLAIELAAARIKLMPPQALLHRLSHRLELLTGGARDLPTRQQTLRNTIQWSYDLLSQEEQRLFRRLSVFVNGCTLEAVEVICLDMTTNRVEVVASLVDKNLLQQTEQEGEEPRFVMLEMIREYAWEALTESQEVEATCQAHAAYFLRLAEETAPKLVGPEQAAWLERLEREHDNLRAAMELSLEQARKEEAGARREMALRLVGALRRFWFMRGPFSEGRAFLEQALAASRGAPAAARVKALSAAAQLALEQGDDEQVEMLAQESLALYRELGARRGIAYSLWLLGHVTWRKKNNFPAARSLFEESLALYREVNDQEGLAWSIFSLADMLSLQGEYAQAQALYEESLAMQRKLGNKRGIARALRHSAIWLFASRGDLQSIQTRIGDSLILSKELGDSEGIASCTWLTGWLAFNQGNLAAAQSLLEESIALFREIGSRWSLAWSLSILAKVKAQQGDDATAYNRFEESLAIAREDGDLFNTAFALEGLARLFAAQGQPTRAARLWGEAEILRERMGILLLPVERNGYEQAVAAAHAQLGERAFATAWAAGRSMTPEQALAAQGQVTIPSPTQAGSRSTLPAKTSPTYPAGLTAREVEILRLVAQGLSDAQVAEQLVISPRTVNWHLTSIYSKLGVSSRAAATRYAIEHQVV